MLLMGMLGACGHAEIAPVVAPRKTYPTRFVVPDPQFDAESTAANISDPPNVDLTEIAAAVGHHGLRTTFTYAKGWNPDTSSRWEIRFEIRSSDGRRLSGAWTQDPASTGLTRYVDLAPRPAGCAGSVSFASATRQLTLVLNRACLPRVSKAGPQPWVRFDTLESVSSWHSGAQILYAWDQLYSRVIAPESERLYLPE
ncbi:MAG: hypothetical protein ACJ72L_09505 [Marmoricola sp.]